MKKLWIIANFKSNLSLQETVEWVENVGSKLERSDDIVVGICPRASVLSEVAKTVKVGGFPILVGSQNVSPFETGAYTGEDPAALLKELISFSLIGHSERRTHFAETDELVVEKVKLINQSELTPLVCVQNAETPVPAECDLIAYEPVFAIGTGTPDTPDNANTVAKQLVDLHSKVRVLYGGSVNKENCAEFVREEYINGLLIGKASLDADEFIAIVNECSLVVK